MNKKLFTLMMVTAAMLSLAQFANAQVPTWTVWTDKYDYAPGETGTLNFAYSNQRGAAITIQTITIVFSEWHAYRNGQWEGNQTLQVNQAVVKDGLYSNSTRFTVPNDGRAKSTSVEITLHTVEAGEIDHTDYIVVTATPRFMDQIVTLFTIQIVMIIVATLILAATVFLSARRPSITWKAEEPK